MVERARRDPLGGEEVAQESLFGRMLVQQYDVRMGHDDLGMAGKDRPATGSLEHRSELGARSGWSAHLGGETYAARAAAEMMCDERRERPRRLARGLLESA